MKFHIYHLSSIALPLLKFVAHIVHGRQTRTYSVRGIADAISQYIKFVIYRSRDRIADAVDGDTRFLCGSG